MEDKSDISRDGYMLKGGLGKEGYDWWWHSFTAHDALTDEEKAFYIEFFIINPALSEDKPVFGQLESNKKKGKKPSYLMVNVGTWGKDKAQLHRFFAVKDIALSNDIPFSVQAADCYLDEKETRGSVNVSKEEALNHPEYLSDSGQMSWKLKILKEIPFNVGYGASKLLRDMEAFQMYWHAEGMKSMFEGEIIYNGRKYIVSPLTSYGYADKNWGKDFTSPWLWLASSHLISRISHEEMLNSAFDIGGGRPKIGHLALDRKLLGYLALEGKGYEFNFSKFWTKTKTVFSFEEKEKEVCWHVEQTNRSYKMVTDVSCQKEDMIFIRYEAPNGQMLHKKLFNGGDGKGTVRLYKIKNKKETLIEELEALNVGCEYGEYVK
jgi:tocopherol cyclase